MPTPQAVEIHHSPGARFQSGNRVYRIVILGQGGVGKSGASRGLLSLARRLACADLCVYVCVCSAYLRLCVGVQTMGVWNGRREGDAHCRRL